MEPVIVASPTSYKAYKECNRKSYLDALNSKGNIHFDYGHAYGHAATFLWARVDAPKEVRLGAAYAAMFAYSKNFENLDSHYANKILPKLIQGLRATDSVIQMFKAQFEYIDTETKIILKVMPKTGIPYVLSGTYDLRLKDKNTGLYHIFDYKAVTGDYLYSWESDPQVAIYETLNQVVSNKLNLDYVYAASGKYLVHYTNKKDELFAVRTVDPSFYKFNLVGVIKNFMRMGREETQSAHGHESIANLITTRSINPYVCKKGNYTCGFYQNCYNNDYNDNKGHDDRRPNKVIVLECSEEDVITAAKQISDRTILRKVEDTDGVMSIEEMDMGVSSLDLETDETMFDLLLDN